MHLFKDPQLEEPLYSTPSAVDQKDLGARLNQYAGSETFQVGHGRACPQQCHRDRLSLGADRREEEQEHSCGPTEHAYPAPQQPEEATNSTEGTSHEK